MFKTILVVVGFSTKKHKLTRGAPYHSTQLKYRYYINTKQIKSYNLLIKMNWINLAILNIAHTRVHIDMVHYLLLIWDGRNIKTDLTKQESVMVMYVRAVWNLNN